MKQLTLINAGFAVDNPLTEDGYRMAAEMIFEEYPYITANEIQLIIKKAIKGEFGQDGKVFNAIDVSKIMTWVRMYYEQRAIVHENLRRIERQSNDVNFEDLIPEVKAKAIQARDAIFKKWRMDDEARRKKNVVDQIEARKEAERLKKEYDERIKQSENNGL